MDSSQEELLQACLLSGWKAVRAWQRWRAVTDLDHLDHGSYGLIPLLYHNLSRSAADDPGPSIFKGIYKRTWYKNQLLLRHLRAFMEWLQAEGLEATCFVEMSLLLNAYPDSGLRPVHAIDLLVRPGDVCPLMQTATRAGYEVSAGAGFGCSEIGFKGLNRPGPSSRHQEPMELHWQFWDDYSQPIFDDLFWPGSMKQHLQGAELAVLDPTDLLFLRLIRGVYSQAGRGAPVWAADTVMILEQSSTAIQWDRFLWQARRLNLLLHCREIFRYLHRVLDLPALEQAVTRLNDQPVSLLQRSIVTGVMRAPESRGWLRAFWNDCGTQYRSSWSRENRLRAAVSILKFLARRWQLKHFWQVPLFMIVRGSRKIMGRYR